MNRDLTVGEPRKVLWSFCLPLFGSIIFQQLYNIADSLVAGKFIGENALAAVGNSYEITLIFIAFAVGCNIGCSVIVSRYFGARDYVSMRSAVSTSMISAAAVCFLLMLVGIIGCGRLLRMIDTPAELFRDSKLYLDIYVWGLPFVFFYNISTGIFSALGDSRTPFLFLAASSLSNIALDVVFVTVFKMGVAGVAWATFICQGVSCALAMTVIARRLKEFRSAGKYPVFSKPIFWQFAVIAVPSTMQQSFVSVGNIIVQRVINGFGAGVMAGYAAGVKLNNLVITSFVTVGNGISNYTSQNIGAGKYSRIDEGFRAGVRMMWTLGIPFILLYFLGGKFLLNLFMDDPTKTAMETGIIYLRILAPFYVVISSKHVADGILRGGGLMKEFMVSTFASLFIRVLGAVFLSRTSLGSTGIWLAWPIGWIAAAACAIYFYKHHRWEKPAEDEVI
ncbi:MAG: MATE family efflux transporter [Oscillospiraceae bacterium]|nr:MATE family efflux transporter [Oscillospiraceae bacterium]